ncbi:thiamine pyrophosphate-dependent dehydrogenase E1 component subunit alpha [Bradyrhizobium sp. 5.13L]
MTLNAGQQAEAYRRMLRIRRFEEEGSRLFKAGRIHGAFHSSIGQEAAIVGACLALSDSDMMTGTHRSHGHPIGKGAKLSPLMAELMGKRTGICKGRGGSMHLADKSVGIIGESAIVGGGIPLATGCALAAKVQDTGQVALSFFGDGAVNQGTFHESLNMASIWNLPVIFFCENNGYAITTSLVESHGQPDIAKRGDGYGVKGVKVDGQDLVAVYEATCAAAARARAGEGPTLIEAATYRFDEHQISLVIASPRAYRPVEEIEYHKSNRDPIVLFRERLSSWGWSAADMLAIEEEVEASVAEAIRFGEESEPPDPSSVYEFMYSNPINYPARSPASAG